MMVGNKNYLLTYLLTYICLERWGGGLCRVPYFDFSKGGGSTYCISTEEMAKVVAAAAASN